MSTFREGRVRVRVPATSANLGPGYDAVGLALALYDEVTAQVGAGVHVEVTGEGADEVPCDESHLVITAMYAAFERLGGRPAGIELSAVNRIPHGRGLGSSAAAIVAGVLLARALTDGGDDLLPDAAVLRLTGELEGHPDNVAPCLAGGLAVAWSDDAGARAIRLEPADTIRPVAFIPPHQAATHEARGLLPDVVPHDDAAFNTARAALLVAALTGVTEALAAATEDRLHQPYRAKTMPDSAELIDRLRQQGIAAVLSGAGPTVLVLARGDVEARRAARSAPVGWRVEPLEIDRHGARLG